MSSLPAWSTHADLRRELSNRQIQQLVRTDRLTRLRRGYYLSTAAWKDLSDGERWTLSLVATATSLDASAVLSHTSAACLHGLWTGALQRIRAHVTWPGIAGRGGTTRVITHRSALDPTEIVEKHGVRVTTVERTLYDIARTADVRLAVAMTDQALHRGLTTRDRLAAVADAKSGHPGAGRARRLFRVR